MLSMNASDLGKRLVGAGILWFTAALAAHAAGIQPATTNPAPARMAANQQHASLVVPVAVTTNPAPMHAVAQQEYLGDAPYICTPSGYGHLASCSLRSRLQTHH